MKSIISKLLLVSILITNAFDTQAQQRERISLNEGWKFFKYETMAEADNLKYDSRPLVEGFNDNKAADAKPTDAVRHSSKQRVLKPWIMPTGNAFIRQPERRYSRPEGSPGHDFPFVQKNFDDSGWKTVNLPHDWAIKGPFFSGENPEVGGGMGRLPSHGVAWYRKSFSLDESDSQKQIYLDIDGAMSYSMVWLNGHLVGGWPYGYSSYRLDLTPYIKRSGTNQLAIRLDNPPKSSRWYPGAGIYRNVWLVKTNSVHVSHWGTQIRTSNVSEKSADITLTVSIDDKLESSNQLTITNTLYRLDNKGRIESEPVSSFPKATAQSDDNKSNVWTSRLTLKNPKLWGPRPTQTPHRYAVITKVFEQGDLLDQYKTDFGIRDLKFDPDKGVIVNNEHIRLQGVNQHHDLGALGAAFNTRAAERQLQLLQEMGVNAIRIDHNPPAPELLSLTDRMGILVLNESFDSWYKKKTPLDFHLIFEDWHEQDLRALVRRDRNHPSVIMWYIGNEVGEQYTGQEGADIALRLKEIVKQEDPERPVTASMNWAKADFPFSAAMDLISLNYQGEGIRQRPEFEGTERIRTPPSYPVFREAHPDKVILSSETASAFSSRGIYLFPVTSESSAPVRDGLGGDSSTHHVSAYELHAVDFGSSADKVFKYMDKYPYVAGQFVWNGWDYLGEPTPYYSSRSSYSGMIDLAGFKKDRFYIYQSQWRPELPMVHILPHWNWSGREGKTTPVHIFTSGDEVELFINGKSQGREKKEQYEYRLRFDDVVYEPGEVKAVAYKDGKAWAKQVIETTGKAAGLKIISDRDVIDADGKDLAFITVEVTDKQGRTVPQATNEVTFSVNGNATIIATDNGDPTNFTPFPSVTRKAFSGKVLAIVKANKGEPGHFTVTATSAEGWSATSSIDTR
ncbi:beta-galactosidase GalB [Alteromonas sp. H39]|uniref:beta-galactosidase GalB n=1 Tax=Alteromonas sp. H39 TaxID=3389876 RepID=UPI0039DF3935